MSGLMDIKELAQYLGVADQTIRCWRTPSNGFGGPPAIKLGRNLLRWRQEDVDAWLKERVEKHSDQEGE
jgi:predicted DNA-binding transcriptional regulator AlpA